MKAWLFTGAHRPLERIERDTPRPARGEVLLKVQASGLCHSDVGRMDGTLTAYMPKPPPIILGHEVAGIVAEIGADVTDYHVGDRVVVSGTLEFSPGRDRDGGYATHCVMPTFSLIRLPQTVSFTQGAVATDAGQTSHHAVVVAGKLRAGQRIGIIGLGGLGMTGARIAVLKGAEVHAAEPRRQAWEVAQAQGVRSIVEDVMGFASLNLDVIVDFAGFGSTTAGAVNVVRRGGRVVQVGLGQTQATISTMDLVAKSVTLRGSAGGSAADTSAVLDLMARGELKIQASGIGFDEIPAGHARLERGGVIGRIVADMGR